MVDLLVLFNRFRVFIGSIGAVSSSSLACVSSSRLLFAPTTLALWVLAPNSPTSAPSHSDVVQRSQISCYFEKYRIYNVENNMIFSIYNRHFRYFQNFTSGRVHLCRVAGNTV